MQVSSRHPAFLALACLFAAAFTAQPLPAAAQTSPGTVLFARPVPGLYAGGRAITGIELFSINDDGSGERQLTPYVRYVYNLPALSDIPMYTEEWRVNAFSPSGRYSLFLETSSDLPFDGNRKTRGKFFLMNALGQRIKPLFSGSDDLESPRYGPSYGSVTWGPAGTNEIAFTNAADDRFYWHHACVRLMHPDGTANHLLWCATPWRYRTLQGVRWSGDGHSLLVYALRTKTVDQLPIEVADLYLIDTATGAATLVQSTISPPSQNGTGDVSYDGHEVVYGVPYFSNHTGSCPVPNDYYSVTWCAKNMLTGQTVPLVDPDNVVHFKSAGQALLSSDGSKVYLTGETGNLEDNPEYEIYSVNTNGTGLRKITRPCASIDSGTWLWWKPVRLSPDGTRMLANCRVEQTVPPNVSNVTQIYVVNLADGSTRYVTHGGAYDWHVPSP
jgi:dipeptidyl aminopeptidase/acylaminoacyl peptidase